METTTPTTSTAPADGAPADLTATVARLRTVVWGLVVTAVFLGVTREIVVLVLGVGGPLGELRPLSVDAEASIPTWIATILLFLGALVWAVPALARRGTEGARVAGVVAVVLLAASIDEGSSLHETLIDPLRDALDLGGVLTFAWVLVGAPILLGLLYALYRVRDRLPEDVARTLLFGAIVFGVGAIGLELVGGQVVETAGRESLAWAASTVVEESLELVGAALACSAGLLLWQRRAPEVLVRLER